MSNPPVRPVRSTTLRSVYIGKYVSTNCAIVTPQTDWNQASGRPGKQGRAWTKDGFNLNGLEFFAGVPDGQPLYRERNKKQNPMPRFSGATMNAFVTPSISPDRRSARVTVSCPSTDTIGPPCASG